MNSTRPITLLLCGDVMTGRGIDQILPWPGDPTLHEPWVTDARVYVELAERANGPAPRGADCSYVWGDALQELERARPDARIINLETSVTTSDDYWRGKEIHYRMNPKNIGCLVAAGIDCCALANNHVLDWGRAGLAETLQSLRQAGVKAAGAGQNQDEAEAPAMIETPRGGRVLVLSLGASSSGIPRSWAARRDRPGVNYLEELSPAMAGRVTQTAARWRRNGDLVVASIHWGGNWGYEVSCAERQFAHRLIDEGQVDVIHGHSSHHVKGIEVYQERLILYGCGDFLTDYEGIHGHEEFRADLGLMHFASLEPSTGRLVRLEMTPTQVHRMQVRRALAADAAWLRDALNREGAAWGVGAELGAEERLALRWTA